MIIFGPIKSVPSTWNGFIVNFNSLYQSTNIPVLNNLLPSIQYNQMNNTDLLKNFDIYYSEYILKNDTVFFEFMHFIIMPWYYGNNVFILIDGWENDSILNINESLIKFIQQRYGFEPYLVNSIEDTDEIIGYGYNDPGCNIFGIKYLDEDKERYSILLEKNIIEGKIQRGEITNVDGYLSEL